MNILITGGTGFVGSHLTERLLRAGHHITVLSTGSARHPNLAAVSHQITWKWGSFNNKTVLLDVLQGIDVVVHAAWTTVPKDASDNPAYDVESNVVGGLHLLDACLQNKIRHFVFISTGGALYGIPQYTPLDERHPLEPISSYGISKATFERYLHFYQVNRGLHYQVFRISNAYGERQNLTKNQGVIGVWLQRIRQGLPIQIWGDGTVIRDYIYTSDIAEAVAKGLDYRGAYQTFNLGYGKGYSLNEILAAIRAVIDQPVEVQYLPSRSFDVPINVLDTTLIRRELQWEPQIALEEGIAGVWQWMKTQPFL